VGEFRSAAWAGGGIVLGLALLIGPLLSHTCERRNEGRGERCTRRRAKFVIGEAEVKGRTDWVSLG
jgi:hypothetical protein